ncbi:MAG: hypothetical protein K0S48_2463 [Ramlibacter sp.]|nr:hypothetical protein [Ramlibacter sp.]
MSVYDKLKELNITLPPVATPAAAYVPFVRTGNLVFLSGHIAKKEGKAWVGQLGKNIQTEEGKLAARAIAIDLMGTLHAAVGDLRRRADPAGCVRGDRADRGDWLAVIRRHPDWRARRHSGAACPRADGSGNPEHPFDLCSDGPEPSSPRRRGSRAPGIQQHAGTHPGPVKGGIRRRSIRGCPPRRTTHNRLEVPPVPRQGLRPRA